MNGNHATENHFNKLLSRRRHHHAGDEDVQQTMVDELYCKLMHGHKKARLMRLVLSPFWRITLAETAFVMRFGSYRQYAEINAVLQSRLDMMSENRAAYIGKFVQ